MKRVVIKTGDVFCAKISNNSKKYFQYVAADSRQLYSHVIRGFVKEYSLEANPSISEIINDEVAFYAHCSTKWGIKHGYWEKIGNDPRIGSLDHIIFKDTMDYGTMPGQEPIKISEKWFVWRINDEKVSKVGKLIGENKKAFIGLVINPKGIIELMKGNKYPPNYPD